MHSLAILVARRFTRVRHRVDGILTGMLRDQPDKVTRAPAVRRHPVRSAGVAEQRFETPSTWRGDYVDALPSRRHVIRHRHRESLAADVPASGSGADRLADRDSRRSRVPPGNAVHRTGVARSGSPEVVAESAFLCASGPRPDNLAAQGGYAATIGSQTQLGKLPVPVLGVVREDPPRDVPGRAARQVEYQVGVLRHYHLLCAPTAMIQSACGNQLPGNALVDRGAM